MRVKILFAVKSKKMETLGVMYLSAVAKKGGHDCRIVTFDEVKAVAEAWQPDTVGFSAMTGDQARIMEIAQDIVPKTIPPGYTRPIMIVGGPHASFFPQDFDYNSTFDYIVPGEAENWMVESLGGPVGRFRNIDDIPWPDRTDFPDMPIRDFITSRGCPFNCSYCYNDRWSKMFPDLPRVRTRSVQDVVMEIVSVVNAKTFVYFQDSCFAVKIPWLREFAHKYRRLVDRPFHCHARPGMITDEYAKLLSQAGCFSLRIALETSSDRLRALINRAHTSNEETIKASRLLKRYGIKLMIQNMLGLPTSTIDEDLETLEVNIRCKPAYGWCSIFQPYPGTDLADLCVKNGWYEGDFSEISDSFFDGSVLNFDDQHKEQLVTLQRIFALAVEAQEMPKLAELTFKNFPKLVHRLMRKIGDYRLYGGVV